MGISNYYYSVLPNSRAYANTKANTSDTKAAFLALNLSISNGFVSSKIYDKRDDFGFNIINFPFLDGDAPRRSSYGVYISQLIRFAKVCSHVEDFNARNKCLTAYFLKQGYRYHKLRKAFFQVLSPTLCIDFKIQCRIKIIFTSRPIGTRILL